jgi:hypothetical protein
LAELDVGGAEPVHRRRHAPAALRRRQSARLDQAQQAEGPLRLRRQVVDLDEAERAGAGEHEAGAGEPEEIAHPGS